MKTQSFLYTLLILLCTVAGAGQSNAQPVIRYFSPAQGEMRISTDGGRSWEVYSPRAPEPAKVKATRILAFQATEVLQSTDGGRSWRKLTESTNKSTAELATRSVPLDVYPIPFEQVVNVKVAPGSSYSVHIVSLTGERLLTISDSQRSGELFTLDLQSIPAGPYILVLRDEIARSQKSIIITKH